jgi:hypothetical protein
MEAEEDPRVMAAHDPETGEILANDKDAFVAGVKAESAEAHAAGQRLGESVQADREASVEQATADALDLGTQRLLDDARAAAKGGTAIFKHWEGRLNSEHYAKLAPYLQQLRAEAASADAVRGA